MNIATHCFTVLCVIGLSQSCNTKTPESSAISNSIYKKGESLLGKNNDSAFYYFSQVATSSKDSLEIATSLNNMAAIQSDQGDYFGAQESLLASLRYLNEKRERDVYCLSSDYNELGTASLNLKNYPEAIDYYLKALSLSPNERYKSVVTNNLAHAYQNNQEYSRALKIYQTLLQEPNADSKTIARTRTNMAATQLAKDSSYDPRNELWDALATRREENDLWGLVSSYGYLSDYYARSNPDSAFFYAKQLYQEAKQLESPDDELDALKKMILLAADTVKARYFIRFQFLNDSLQTARNNAKNQFALIRYEAEKSKSDNLALQTENVRKQFQIFWQWGLLFAILISSAWGIWWYRKRQQQTKWAAEKQIREHELQTSQKVHDVVAGGLYRIMTEIEHRPDLAKNQLLDSIEFLYERSRDISYEKPLQLQSPAESMVTEILLSYASDQRTVLIRGNEAEVWEGLNNQLLSELEKILSELMINMKKHSGARNVVVKFQRENNKIHVEYTDDGNGLPESFRPGNGLTGTENRIKALGGIITFAKHEPKGLRISFHIPIRSA
jgi:tetratricopeptide (TPR) repeat protein